MAVYTDINEGDLGAFLADYDVGELQSYRGIAEGVESPVESGWIGRRIVRHPPIYCDGLTPVKTLR